MKVSKHNELVADDEAPGDHQKIDQHPGRGRHFRWPLNTRINEMATRSIPRIPGGQKMSKVGAGLSTSQVRDSNDAKPGCLRRCGEEGGLHERR